MNNKVGQVSFYGMQNDSFTKPYSEETSGMIDEEVRNLVNSQFDRAKALLKERRNELELLAGQLLEKEVLLKSDVERLIGRRPYGMPEELKANHNGSHPHLSKNESENIAKEANEIAEDSN